MKVVPVTLAEKIRKASNNASEQIIDLIEKLIVYDPNKRLSAS